MFVHDVQGWTLLLQPALFHDISRVLMLTLPHINMQKGQCEVSPQQVFWVLMLIANKDYFEISWRCKVGLCFIAIISKVICQSHLKKTK